MLDEDRRVVVHPLGPGWSAKRMGNNPAESHWRHMVDLGRAATRGRLEYQWVSPVRRGGPEDVAGDGLPALGLDPGLPVCCCRTLEATMVANMSGWVAPPCW